MNLDDISKYVDKYLNKSSSYEDSINNFIKLESFIEKNNYNFEDDFWIRLVKRNANFSAMIQNIVNGYKNSIVSDKIKNIFDNDMMSSAIYAYCIVNDIEIDESCDLIYDTSNLELSDSLYIYLNEMGKTPLLSQEEEKKLALRVLQGDSYAKDLLIESNLRLVVAEAKKYYKPGRVPLLDLIQEGNIGLMRAVDKYDINLGTRFSTYATYWIRQAIVRSIPEKSRNIKISNYKNRMLISYSKVLNDLENKLNRQPKIEEIAEEMNLSVSAVSDLYKLCNDTVSINALVGDNYDTEFGDLIVDSDISLEDKVIEGTFNSQIIEVLKVILNSRELGIIIRRFGLNDCDVMTLDEIGKEFNLTKERIRQIEFKAIEKLKVSRYFENFIKGNNIEFSRENEKRNRQLFLNKRNDKDKEADRISNDINKYVSFNTENDIGSKRLIKK